MFISCPVITLMSISPMLCLLKFENNEQEINMSDLPIPDGAEKSTTGILYVVATPIGNLEDVTLRALRVLKEADLICAEDTRKTRILLNHYNIQTALTSYFEHNEKRKTPFIIEKLKSGKNIAIVSEAGTPAISDPGYRLITQALQHAISVIPIPGPSAVITAISISGLPLHRFAFEGFLPVKSGKKKNFLNKIREEERTLVFYESPHRIINTLRDLIEVMGDRNAVLCRELTKLHEEKIYGELSLILKNLEKRPIKGEITLLVEGKKSELPRSRAARHLHN
jgi:16S rRNA (cytidine1402-2'-O)-methyltransferase